MEEIDKIQKKVKVVRKITPQRLKNIALFYLKRFESSTANLRTVLQRRVNDYARLDKSFDKTEAWEWIENLLADFQRLGYLDDRRYCALKVKDYLVAGKSSRYIMGKMREKGISSVNVEYHNWNSAGLSGKVDGNPRPLSKIGGEEGYAELETYLEQNGGRVYLNTAAMTFQNGSMSASTNFDSVKKLGNITVEEYPVTLNTVAPDTSQKARLFLSHAKLNTLLTRMFQNFAKWGNRNLAFSDIGNLAYADHSDKQTVFRQDGIEQLNQTILDNQASYDSLLLHDANMYSFRYAGYISDLPTESSGYSIADESVPFLQMVLHGAVKYAVSPVNMSSEPQKAVLKAIETGSELSFAWIYEEPSILHNTSLNTLFASDYRLWMDFAAESYQKASSALKEVSGLTMTGHECLAEGVYQTEYENGVRIIVNYNDTAVTTDDGVMVNAMDFIVIGEGE